MSREEEIRAGLFDHTLNGHAPEVKAPVREAREAEYTEKGSGPDMTTIRTESTVLELVSFRPGK